MIPLWEQQNPLTLLGTFASFQRFCPFINKTGFAIGSCVCVDFCRWLSILWLKWTANLFQFAVEGQFFCYFVTSYTFQFKFFFFLHLGLTFRKEINSDSNYATTYNYYQYLCLVDSPCCKTFLGMSNQHLSCISPTCYFMKRNVDACWWFSAILVALVFLVLLYCVLDI